jgi:hypothetical protein
MALLLDDDPPPIESLAGRTVGAYTITRDDVDLSLRPALAYVRTLLTPGVEFYLETHVKFPGITNTFGTADLIIRVGDTVYVLDFKFGSGVLIRAIYPDGDEDVINAQLMFYGAGARHSLPGFFAGIESVVLVIVQPRSAEPDAEMVSSVEVTNAELDEFVRTYRRACEEALAPSPRLERGSWCRFCAARPICPAHTGPLLDLSQFKVPAPPLSWNGAFAASPAKAEYLRMLGEGLQLADAAQSIITALRDQAKQAADAGWTVPGHALTAGRAERYWRDESAAVITLQGLGLDRGDIIEETMRSPYQVERRAKARGLKVPSDLINSRRSGTSLVRIENVRVPVLSQDESARLFTEKLNAVLGGRQP